jgi:hypothetical protein
MTDLGPDSGREGLDDAVALWLDDDLARAAGIFARFRAEAERRHLECVAMLPGAHRRDPAFRAALRGRMTAHVRKRAARRFLAEALTDWRPAGEGN